MRSQSTVRVGGCCCGVPFGCSLVVLVGVGGACVARFAPGAWATVAAALGF